MKHNYECNYFIGSLGRGDDVFRCFLKKKHIAKIVAILGVALLIIANWLEFAGLPFFDINTRGMLQFGTFGLLFNTVAYVSTLVFFMLSGAIWKTSEIMYLTILH